MIFQDAFLFNFTYTRPVHSYQLSYRSSPNLSFWLGASPDYKNLSIPELACNKSLDKGDPVLG